MTRTTEDLIREARQRHGLRYDYSRTVYTNANEKFRVICSKHGEWETTYSSHVVNGHGCQRCGAQRQAPDLDKIKEKFRSKHGNFYDYSKVVWNNLDGPGWHQNIIIGCPIHSEFKQKPAVHYYQSAGCPQCKGMKSSEKQLKKLDVFLQQVKDRHGDHYDYSKTVYKGDQKNIDIGCKTHGRFTQRADHHLNSRGCPKCHHDRLAIEFAYNFEQFKERARKEHNDRFEYVDESWTSYKDEITVICPDHGEFRVVAKYHANGTGCKTCSTSRLGRNVEKVLMDYNISYVKEKKFKGCKNIFSLPFDYYLPEYDALIECDGEQHYVARKNGLFTEDKVVAIQFRDLIKTNWAQKNQVPLLRVRYDCKNINLIVGLFLFAILKSKRRMRKIKKA